jgi:DNA polymerase-3 subunit beta
MDLTATTTELSRAATDIARLLPARSPDPLLSGLLLTATAEGLVMAGTDRERSVRLSRTALTHTDGTVLVPARPFAETLRTLAEPEIRLVVEGSRLAVRTGRGRFALPLMDADLHPGVAAPPPLTGTADGSGLLRAFAAVAGAASRDEALPLFTGVRIRAHGDTLRLIATDRYRLAVAELPWRPVGPLDVLVPATLVTEIARQAAGAPELALHADQDRVAVSWRAGDTIGSALLATPFPDESRYLVADQDAAVELSVAELTGAVRRAGLYADGRGAITIELADGEVRVRGGSQEIGEAEESVKAEVTGRIRQTYRARYLLDALRAFDGERVRLGLRDGMKATVFTGVGDDQDGLALRYVVMPILPA